MSNVVHLTVPSQNQRTADRHAALLRSFAQHRRFGDLGHPAQQPQRCLVAGLQRPFRESDEVGEHDGHLGVDRAAGHLLGQRLPDLQARQADLPGRRGAITDEPIRGAGRGASMGCSGRSPSLTRPAYS